MIYFLSQEIDQEFQDNLKDWCAGGPKKSGWTRRGLRVKFPCVKLSKCVVGEIDIEDVLAKNRAETDRWHLHYLRYYLSGMTFNWQNSHYYWEYLKPRYDDVKAKKCAIEFLELFDSIEDNGLHKPVWVADIADLDLGFKYFRFDGCHRACCCKTLGHKTIPALIFKAEVCDWNDLSSLHIFPNKHDLQQHRDSSLRQRHLL